MDKVLCYLTNCPCELGAVATNDIKGARDFVDNIELGEGVAATTPFLQATTPFLQAVRNDMDNIEQWASEHQEPENKSDVGMDTGMDTGCVAAQRTKLKKEAPAFQPVQTTDTRMDAVANAAYLALVSCGQICNIKMEKGIKGQSPSMISAELHGGPRAASRCYDVMQLTKQALEAVTERLPTTALISARVQKEECGYSLRSNIACLPEGAEDRMCWDMYRRGYCPRRSQCRWYHPCDSDIARIKISIRYSEEVSAILGKEQLEPSSLEKHKLSLGELI